ncbi:MAG: hypothetical protein OCD00_18300 [Colwellia sp.]
MKGIHYLVFLCLYFSGAAKSAELSITGDWNIIKVIESGKMIKLNTAVSFASDNKFIVSETDVGEWRYYKDKNILTIKSVLFKELSGNNEIISYESNALVLKNKKSIIYFEKINQQDVLLKNKNSGLIGTWEISDENSKTILSFLLPDKFTSVTIDPMLETSSKGTWVYNRKRKTISIIARMNELAGESPINIENNRFSLNLNGIVVEAFKQNKFVPKIETLNYELEDFYDENEEFKYETHDSKLPWRVFSDFVNGLEKTKQLVYRFSTLASETQQFYSKILKADVSVKKNDLRVDIDYIFNGFDKSTVHADVSLPPNPFDTQEMNKLYPLKSELYRIVGQEKILTLAGEFECTVLEAMSMYGNKQKLWMINNMPGIYAKIIIESTAGFGEYFVYQLENIIER